MDQKKNENIGKDKTTTKNKKNKKKKSRCSFDGCKKKLKLTNLECRCKNRFCNKHRLPECHNCQWDPRSNDEIKKYKKDCCLNVTAHFSKIDKI